jgi:demethylmenaquinone methyltransferase/2-methoxy-6-polyprenyl-1,4-benzoquinol methylase
MIQDDKAVPSREGVWSMFDRIAPRYDFLNRLLTLGLDVAWRKHMADFLPAHDTVELLDIATGTGDQIFHILERDQRVTRAVGVDLAEKMLDIGREKVKQRGLDQVITLQTADALKLPFPDGSFDAVTISFGIRNVVDVPAALREMRRILRPGGRALILECSKPASPILRAGYTFYMRYIMPAIGAIISGDGQAYRYLNRTVETFPYGDAFCALMRDAGFANVKANPQTLSVATIYQGDK